MKEDEKEYITMYVIEDERIEEYPIRRTLEGGPNVGCVVQYIVEEGLGTNPDRIHSYTEGAHSYDVGQRFQLSSVGCVLSFLKMHGEEYTYGFLMDNDDDLKNFIIRVQNTHPEYFI